ncbi:MAG: hypothetical protein LC808_12750, partial [Actinobacteria bacterium]|nr:hypothetical protein [Actinomycetota bacterium]
AVKSDPCVEVRAIGGTGGECRALGTPGGNVVYIEDLGATASGRLATRVIGESVVYLSYTGLSDDEVTHYFDSLAPRDPLTIDYINNDG